MFNILSACQRKMCLQQGWYTSTSVNVKLNVYNFKFAQNLCMCFLCCTKYPKTEKYPRHFFLFFVCNTLYLIQQQFSDTKTLCMHILRWRLKFSHGRQKKATPSPMLRDTFLYRLHFLRCKNSTLKLSWNWISTLDHSILLSKLYIATLQSHSNDIPSIHFEGILWHH